MSAAAVSGCTSGRGGQRRAAGGGWRASHLAKSNRLYSGSITLSARFHRTISEPKNVFSTSTESSCGLSLYRTVTFGKTAPRSRVVSTSSRGDVASTRHSCVIWSCRVRVRAGIGRANTSEHAARNVRQIGRRSYRARERDAGT